MSLDEQEDHSHFHADESCYWDRLACKVSEATWPIQLLDMVWPVACPESRLYVSNHSHLVVMYEEVVWISLSERLACYVFVTMYVVLKTNRFE